MLQSPVVGRQSPEQASEAARLTNGEARRKIGEGAVRLNGEAVSDPMLVIDVGGAPVKLSLGKKKHGLLTRS